MVIPVSGWAMERFGPKQMWMFSLALFPASSVAGLCLINTVGVPPARCVLVPAAGDDRYVTGTGID